MIAIEFDIVNDTFAFESNDDTREIITNVLRSHIGAGVDKTKPVKRDLYTIEIEWDLSDDSFVLRSDTGNKSLTDGILLHFLNTL